MRVRETRTSGVEAVGKVGPWYGGVSLYPNYWSATQDFVDLVIRLFTPSPFDLRLTVSEHTRLTRLTVGLGMQDLAVGHERFNDRFLVRGSNERIIARVFDPSLCAGLMRCHRLKIKLRPLTFPLGIAGFDVRALQIRAKDAVEFLDTVGRIGHALRHTLGYGYDRLEYARRTVALLGRSGMGVPIWEILDDASQLDSPKVGEFLFSEWVGVQSEQWQRAAANAMARLRPHQALELFKFVIARTPYRGFGEVERLRPVFAQTPHADTLAAILNVLRDRQNVPPDLEDAMRPLVAHAVTNAGSTVAAFAFLELCRIAPHTAAAYITAAKNLTKRALVSPTLAARIERAIRQLNEKASLPRSAPSPESESQLPKPVAERVDRSSLPTPSDDEH